MLMLFFMFIFRNPISARILTLALNAMSFFLVCMYLKILKLGFGVFAAVRSNILIVLGSMVECFPSMFEEDNTITILNLCLDSLDEQLRQKSKDPLFVLVAGAMRCLDGVLMCFDRTLPAGGKHLIFNNLCKIKLVMSTYHRLLFFFFRFSGGIKKSLHIP